MFKETPVFERRVYRRKTIYILLSLVIILLGTTVYFSYQYQKLSKSPMAAQFVAQKEAEKLIFDVSKLMLLPKGETPTIAAVTDIEKLKDQPFFKDATNGNKVLIYSNSKLAIIYDPETNLIINAGSINLPEPESQLKEDQSSNGN